MTEAYFAFYNQLREKNLNSNQLIEQYINFMYSMDSHFTCGFLGLLEGGNYLPRCVNTTDTTVSQHRDCLDCSDLDPLIIPLITNDVHEEIYALEDVIIDSQLEYEHFPYIVFSDYQKLDIQIKKLNQDQQNTFVLFNLRYNHFIIATLCLFTTLPKSECDHYLEFYRFLKNNLESLITEYYLHDELAAQQRMTDTARNIVNSKRYYSYDKSIVLARLLDLAFELLEEPDYGSALLYENGEWHYVHAIGHDIDALSKIRIPEEMYNHSTEFWANYQEVAQHIYYIENILDIKTTNVSTQFKETLDIVKKVSLPIRQTIQLHLSVNDVFVGIISLDIKENSLSSFTRKTINILSQLHYLGQFLLTYSSLAITTQSFEELTDLLSRMIIPSTISSDTFLPLFLKLLVRRLVEADYASAYIVDSEGIHFLAAVGHNLEGLQSINLQAEHFANPHDLSKTNTLIQRVNDSQENPTISIVLFTDLIKNAKSLMPEDVYASFTSVSRPIKDGLIAEARLEDGVYMNISVDIAIESDSNFSKESIQLFTTLINLGFSFISNQYYITKYQDLNKDLSQTVLKRTQALENTNRKLRDIASKDSLTGLLNHKHIIAQLTKLVVSKKTFSVFLFDIDHFKIVNDLFGHQIGDMVLLKISHLLKQDKSIICGRYGGEEFLILLPDIELSDAVVYCQDLLIKIENYEFIRGHTVTISGGVVGHHLGTATEIIQVADAYLYQAKNSGRNRIEHGYC